MPCPNGESTFERLLYQITALDFKAQASEVSSEGISLLRDSFTVGLRPGEGLLGNQEEERQLQCPDMETEVSSTHFREDITLDDRASTSIPIASTDLTTGTEQDIEMADASFSDLIDSVGFAETTKGQSILTGGGQLEGENNGSGLVTANADEQDVLRGYNGAPHSRDFIQLEDGETAPVWEYFGDKWVRHIKALYDITPIDAPQRMKITPHEYQLKGAAQADWCCKGRFKGFLLGDEMGVGKTLTGILAMFIRKDEPGMSLVIAPASLCRQWVETIHNSWEDGYGLRALHLTDSSMTASDLLASGVDVVVCSYEFAEANSRAMRKFADTIQEYANARDGSQQPKRPTTALHSHMWTKINLPFKVVILDEAQKVNKREGLRHEAIKNGIFAKSYILMSGTLPHNKWYDISGYLAFLKGHPFQSHTEFLQTFSTFDHTGQIDRPDTPRIRLLQRFLQAFLIARPSAVLKMGNCHHLRVSFLLNESEAFRVTKNTLKYKEAARREMAKTGPRIDAAYSQNIGFLSLAVLAQLASLHPMLYEAGKSGRIGPIDPKDPDISIEFLGNVGEEQNDLAREEWLQTVSERVALCEESGRVTKFLELYTWFRKEYPSEKMVIFSSFLKFLDIISEALRRKMKVEALRFDGTVSTVKRRFVEQAFINSDPAIPLLITCGAGGIGLNITVASIVIQLEVWWNRNTELQAVSRSYRQGQLLDVKYVRLQASNSMIDSEILAVQRKKSEVNKELMGPLLRLHNEEPVILDLLNPGGFPPLELEL